ncbi:hypothetical protein XENOCAPTIV_018512 [Xenoophorus captivus]|uniref:Uncharacterized protein n=1 Tax=Xenoophorus captivus TaxID=1517983 RepID=A0ABV0QAJ2_9TELE
MEACRSIFHSCYLPSGCYTSNEGVGAVALSRRPCENNCQHCHRVEERSLHSVRAAHLLMDDSTTEEIKSLSLQHLQEYQLQDPVLAGVHAWMESGQQPGWGKVSDLNKETKALHSHWQGFQL